MIQLKNESVDESFLSRVSNFLRSKDFDSCIKIIDDWFSSLKPWVFHRAMRETEQSVILAAFLIMKNHGLRELLLQMPKGYRLKALHHAQALLDKELQSFQIDLPPYKEESRSASSIVSILLDS